jgi:hypothetical protein
MAAGDVEVRIIDKPFTTATLDTALTAMRVTAGANGKFMAVSCADQIILFAITE